MKKAEWFVSNFIKSLLCYFAIILLSYLILVLVHMAGVPFEGVSSFPLWAKIVVYLQSLIFVALCFMLGLKLKLLGKQGVSHLLNYLSVCGSALIALPFASARTYIFIFMALPFMGISLFSETVININFDVQLIIVSLLPSLATWLGMIHQSSRRGNIET